MSRNGNAVGPCHVVWHLWVFYTPSLGLLISIAGAIVLSQNGPDSKKYWDSPRLDINPAFPHQMDVWLTLNWGPMMSGSRTTRVLNRNDVLFQLNHIDLQPFGYITGNSFYIQVHRVNAEFMVIFFPPWCYLVHFVTFAKKYIYIKF